MLDRTARLLGRQLGRPSGRLGGLMGPLLNRSNRQINATAVDLLGVGPDHAVLDIGFGGGFALARLTELTNALVAGVELSEPMHRNARRRFRREIDAGLVDLRSGGVEAIPFPDGGFDRVLSVNTIYFWPDPAAGLAEVLRVLRPEGRLVLGTFPAESMRKRSYTRQGFRFFDHSELERLLGDAGFSEVRVERRDGRVYSSATKPRSSA